MNFKQALTSVLTAMLLLLCLSLSSCCLDDIFDDDNTNPSPHNDGDAGDV